MRVLCVIDDLGLAGGQRQVTNLAILLKHRGHEVTVVFYREPRTMSGELAVADIPVVSVPQCSRLWRAVRLRAEIRKHEPDVVVAFLPAPVLYAEIGALPSRRWGLVVSERSAVPGAPRLSDRLRRSLHRIADAVVTNSHANRFLIEQSAPALKGRVITIYNSVDLRHFRHTRTARQACSGCTRLVAASNYRPVKNPIGFAHAVRHALDATPALDVRIDWYGDDAWRNSSGATYRSEVASAVDRLGLGDLFRLHGAVRDIAAIYRSADAVAMPSLYEGLPNTVCEAMACGRPVLASMVSDVPLLVAHGRNGLLFDPLSSDEMARTVAEFCTLTAEAREEMGRASRVLAERIFDGDRITDTWIGVLTAAASRLRPAVSHWIPYPDDLARPGLSGLAERCRR